MSNKNNKSTSWEKVGHWYNKAVGKTGMHYHQTLVIPGVMNLLMLSLEDRLLDLGCGQGVLSRNIDKKIFYTGIDISPKLVKIAKSENESASHSFFSGDATKKLPIDIVNFTHVTIILALQNMEHPELAIKNAAKHLIAGGKLVIAMNHPCYRIPRMSSWGIDESKKIQYRRVDNYMSPQKIPILAQPSKGDLSESTLSFHHPLTDYFTWLGNAGFAVDKLEEWCSDKSSTGSKAKMEDRARNEFPLFLALRAIKMK